MDETGFVNPINKMMNQISGIQGSNQNNLPSNKTQMNNQQNDPNNIAILNNRAKIWLLLGSCITKVNRMEISKILNLNLGILFLDIKQNISLPLKKSASYVILRCTKEMPKIFDSNRLGKIIELFWKIIFSFIFLNNFFNYLYFQITTII